MLKQMFLWVFYFILKGIFSLRYRLKIEGLEDLKNSFFSKKEGVLFLANHPAEIDPILLYLALWPHFPCQGILTENFFQPKFLSSVMRLLGFFPVPSTQRIFPKLRERKNLSLFNYIQKKLEGGENFFIYPAEKIKYSSKETLQGVSFAPHLLKSCSHIPMVLVRITGLWGSRFSRAFSLTNPNFFEGVKQGIKLAFINGFFFLPQRTVHLKFECIPADFPFTSSCAEINQYLENWFNLEGPEPLSLVSNSFWQQSFSKPIEEKKESSKKTEKIEIPAEIEKEVCAKLAELSSQPLTKIQRPTRLIKDLGLDSLDMVQLYAFLSKKYHLEGSASLEVESVEDILYFLVTKKSKLGIEKQIRKKLSELSSFPATQMHPGTHLSFDLGLDSLDREHLFSFLEYKYHLKDMSKASLETIEDLVFFVMTQKEENLEDSLEKGWKVEPHRPLSFPPLGETIPLSFLLLCDKMKNFEAVQDPTFGCMTYKELKLMVLLLARKIRNLEGNYIGILLPSSILCYALILAVLLAKKIPVMLNWTIGTRFLDHVVQATGVETIFSSLLFLERAELRELGKVEERLILMEDFKKTISLKDKIVTYLDHLKKTNSLVKKYNLHEIKKENPAVILFTTGTESFPKGVPLSHENILENQKSALSSFSFKVDEVFYNALPPFHAFGFSMTGLTPILIGVRAYYGSDPTDMKATAEGIEKSSTTFFSSTPTFVQTLLKSATFKQIASLRYLITGAEKTPPAFFEELEKTRTNIEMGEGYGITECSPLVTLTGKGEKRKGVGKPLAGIDLCIIHPETQQVLERGKEGEICIAGPNVFKGYLGETKHSPFIEINQKKWYRSGDLGFLDEEGNLILSGRLKRFVKIGGEMVSLGGLEEDFSRWAIEKKWTLVPFAKAPFIAVSSLEEKNKPLLVVFTSYVISTDEINQALRENGYGNLIKIGKVYKRDQPFLTGTGKTDYRALEQSAKI